VTEPYNELPIRWLTYKLPSSSVRGLTSSIWSRGTKNVEVTGYWGLNYVPDDIAQVTLAVAVVYWRRYQSGNLNPQVAASTSTGMSRGSLRTRGQVVVIDPEIEGLLAQLDAGWKAHGLAGA
jgi:hypothetical protein